MLSFNNHIPGVIFKVQQTGTMVQIKPFASYYAWIDWFDLAPLDQSMLIDDLQTDVDAATAAAAAAQTTADTAQSAAEAAQFDAGGAAILAGFAQTTANTGVTNAATAQAAAVAAQVDADAALAAIAAIEYPTSYFINPRSMKVNSVGFGTFVAATADVMAGSWVMTGLNAEVEVHLPVMAGNYKFMAVCSKYNLCGKVTLYLDNNPLTEFDLYSAAVVRNQEIVWTLNTVAKGPHTFHFRVTDKHASSGGYQCACSFMTLWKV